MAGERRASFGNAQAGLALGIVVLDLIGVLFLVALPFFPVMGCAGVRALQVFGVLHRIMAQAVIALFFIFIEAVFLQEFRWADGHPDLPL